MRRKKLVTLLGSVCLILVLASLPFMAACPAPEEDGDGDLTPTPTEVIKWRVQSFYPGGAPYASLVSEFFCDTVGELSGGRLDITPYGSGAIVPFGETVDAVSRGTIEGAIWWASYDTGRNMAATIFGGAIPFGLSGEEWLAWFTNYGGLELMEELYGQWNIKPIGPMTAGPTQIFLHLKKPAYSLEELSGRIVRMAAIEAEIIKEFGIEPIILPAAEIYTAFETGVIDGIEYAAPSDNWGLGFHEIGKYIVLPGWHSTACPVFLLVNQDTWNELPDDLKYIVEVAAHETWTHQRGYEIVDAAQAMERFKDYGCEFIRLPDEDLAALDEVGQRILNEYAAEDPFFAEVLNSIREFQELMEKTRDLEDVSHN
ncbi:Lactate-binding periplasmic protein [subsurface metagenome]